MVLENMVIFPWSTSLLHQFICVCCNFTLQAKCILRICDQRLGGIFCTQVMNEKDETIAELRALSGDGNQDAGLEKVNNGESLSYMFINRTSAYEKVCFS